MNRKKLQSELFLIIIGMWIIFGLLNHWIIMPIFNNQLVHCLMISIVFGIFNYFIMHVYYRKYLKLERSNKTLQNTVDLDTLTGLLNRGAFEKQINEMTGSDLYSIIFIDIDDFRMFNNHYGHDVGDAVLQNVSSMIKKVVRSGDQVYRYGGEEIVAILRDCDKDNATNIAEKIRLNVMNMNNMPFTSVSLSIGVATYPDDGEDIKQIIKESDNALLKAKRLGKNCVYTNKKNIEE